MSTALFNSQVSSTWLMGSIWYLHSLFFETLPSNGLQDTESPVLPSLAVPSSAPTALQLLAGSSSTCLLSSGESSACTLFLPWWPLALKYPLYVGNSQMHIFSLGLVPELNVQIASCLFDGATPAGALTGNWAGVSQTMSFSGRNLQWLSVLRVAALMAQCDRTPRSAVLSAWFPRLSPAHWHQPLVPPCLCQHRSVLCACCSLFLGMPSLDICRASCLTSFSSWLESSTSVRPSLR